jgi:hypothetical protein
MVRAALVVCVVAFTVACAGHTGSVAGGGCYLPAADSAFLLGGPLYPLCAVQHAAQRTGGELHPTNPPSTAGERSGCFSVDIEVVVDSTGHPETQTARIVKTTDDSYGQSILALVPTWKFTPAIRDNRPVRQVFATHESVMFATVRVPAGGRVAPPPRGQIPRC